MLAVDSRTALQNYSIGLPLTRRTQYSIIFIRSAKTGFQVERACDRDTALADERTQCRCTGTLESQ